MSEEIVQSSVIVSQSLPQSLPQALPSIDVTIRRGELSDIPFMDALQKQHTKQVGWMPTKQFEGKVRAGEVLIAEEQGERRKEQANTEAHTSSLSPCSLLLSPPLPVGYLIASDRYFKRDDVGVIYQVNVVPGRQRGLVGASLLKAQFERSAYGCKLYCCWCAQDIAANRFWEAMGFVPLAFRAGSEKKSRVHVFWQKRIRAGDTTTPWWFPSKTTGGSIREDRIVLPIPPGTHWSDAVPIVLPVAAPELPTEAGQEMARLEGRKRSGNRKAMANEQVQKKVDPTARRNGLTFAIPQQDEVLPEAVVSKSTKREKAKPPRVARKADARLVTAARELRDRWLEQVNAQGESALRPRGKYDVSREIEMVRADGRTIEASENIARLLTSSQAA